MKGIEPTDRIPSRGGFDEEPEITTAAPKRTANPEPSFPDSDSVVTIPQPEPDRNPARDEINVPEETPETDSSYDNPDLSDPYNSYESNPSESNTYEDATNEYVPPS